jgi:hypothetical protein
MWAGRWLFRLGEERETRDDEYFGALVGGEQGLLHPDRQTWVILEQSHKQEARSSRRLAHIKGVYSKGVSRNQTQVHPPPLLIPHPLNVTRELLLYIQVPFLYSCLSISYPYPSTSLISYHSHPSIHLQLFLLIQYESTS